MKIRKVHFYSHFENDGSGTPPAGWTNRAGVTDVYPSPAAPEEVHVDRYVRVEGTAAGVNNGVMSKDSPPTQSAEMQYYWKLWSRGDTADNYDAGMCVFANGTNPDAGAFTGYIIHQTATELILDRYNAGVKTNQTTQTLAAVHGKEYWFWFKYNPATGAWTLARGQRWLGKWDSTYTGTDGSPIASGTNILVFVKKHATNPQFAFDDIKVAGPDDQEVIDFSFSQLVNDFGSFEFTVLNTTPSAAFSRYGVGDYIEMVAEREDGVEFIEMYGRVEHIDDNSVIDGKIVINGHDTSYELMRVTDETAFAATAIYNVISSLLLNATNVPRRTVAVTASTTITRNFKGRPVLEAIAALAKEAGLLMRLTARQHLAVVVETFAGGELLPGRDAILGATPLVYFPLFENFDNDGAFTRIVDHSTNNSHGTTSGGLARLHAQEFIRGLDFDGINGYVSFPFSQALSGFTLMVWFKTSTDAKLICQLQQPTNPGDPMIYLGVGNLGAGGTANKLNAYVRNNAGVAVIPLNGSVTVTDGLWHFGVLWWDGTNVKLYVDDAEVATNAFSGTISINGGSEIAGLGRLSNATHYFDGLMTNFAFFPAAKARQTLTDLYTAFKYGVSINSSEGNVHAPKAEKDGAAIKNKVRVYGDAGISGSADDSSSQTTYGIRELVVVDERIGNATEAGNLATALKNSLKDLNTSLTFNATDYHELRAGQRCKITISPLFISGVEYLIVEKSFALSRGCYTFKAVPASAKYLMPLSPAQSFVRAAASGDKKSWRKIG